MNLENFNVEEGKEYIYLVMVEYKDKTLLKIGYTKTLNERMDTYELHNPDFQLLKIREGSRRLEGYMHKKFEKYAYPKRDEWFYFNEEIIEGFNTLEEKIFLDIEKLKAKIYNLLKPKTVVELKKIYCTKYEKEIRESKIDLEELSYVIVDSFTYINIKIEEFIKSLDYSEISFELDPLVHYQIIIPNPLSSSDIFIDLDQILDYQYLKGSLKEKTINLVVKTINTEDKSIKKEFYKRVDEKENTSRNLLSVYHKVDREEARVLAEFYEKLSRVYHYKDNYITVNRIPGGTTLVPNINNFIVESEKRAFEIQQMDYDARFSTIKSNN